MAAPRYEVELKFLSATNLKNVNWKHGPLRPYIVAWLDADPSAKATTPVAPLADSGPDGVDPVWDADDDPVRAKVVLPLPLHADLDDTVLLFDVVHAADPKGTDEEGAAGKVKPLVGSGRIVLRDVLEEVGIGERTVRSVRLKRPSGRPQGVLDVKICVREPHSRYHYDSHPPPAAAAPYYGAGGYPANASRDTPYGYGGPVGYPYGSAPAAPPPTGGYGSYGYAAQPAGYAPYGAPPAEPKKSKFGVGAGVAVGAAAGLVGGIALAEGFDHIKEDIAEDAAEKVEEDLAEEYGGYDDDF